MRAKTRDLFTSIRTEGGLLPADLLVAIAKAEDKALAVTPDAYNLVPGERLGEAIGRAWNQARGLWAGFQAARAKLPEGDAGLKVTRERWLVPLFDRVLGYGPLEAVHPIVFDEKDYALSHRWRHAPIHLLGAGVPLDRRTHGVPGADRTSPHGLVQELLNRSDDHLWAFVSNGLQLRVLRDNKTLTRQAFVEFDLETMMDGEVYADFALFWLICHPSRLDAERPEQCALERWSKEATDRGTRALDQLRVGVEEAIKALGSGFLAYDSNVALRQHLQSGALSREDLYRQLLRVVYRLLFLFVAEDRDLLADPRALADSKRLYRQHYSTARLRGLARKMKGSTNHDDLWQSLLLVFGKLDVDGGCAELGLPALGSFLWSKESTAGLLPVGMPSLLSNASLLDAVRALAFIVEKKVRRGIDFKNLGAEELGSVYESLLELVVDVNVDARTFELRSAAGNERKTTGSYYTPDALIQDLLDSALEPVVDAALKEPNPAAAILALKVCDPACGSGHFLIAAAHRLARRLASVRTGDAEPAPEEMRRALRDVIGHCIYGVDINEMAVELCKVGLWLEALEPGKPLSFLDARIQCGNSLIGATPALLKRGIPDEAFEPVEGDDKKVCSAFKKRNKAERVGNVDMFAGATEPWMRIGDVASELRRLDAVDDDSVEGVREKQRRYAALVSSDGYRATHLWADAFCAAFFWKKSQAEIDAGRTPITEDVFRLINRNPAALDQRIADEVERLAREGKFFHWHLAFPDVFEASQMIADTDSVGWKGGFNCVLGNPPWERVKLQEQEWFASRVPDIAHAATAAVRKKLIAALAEGDPVVFAAFKGAVRLAEGESAYLRRSGRFPMCGTGDVNTYAVFAETALALTGAGGRAGIIVPSGLVTDESTSAFFRFLVERSLLRRVSSFENEEHIFIGVHNQFKFSLVTIEANNSAVETEFVFFARQVADTRTPARRFRLGPAELALLNPNTRTCPTFRTARDAAINLRLYSGAGVLVRENGPDPWRVRFLRMFDMANDSALFRRPSDSHAGLLPLYEAKMVHLYDHRFSTYAGATQANLNKGTLPRLTDAQHARPEVEATPDYWVPQRAVDERVPPDWQFDWFIGWRDVARSVDERTMICSLVPRVGTGHKLPLLLCGESDARLAACLLANLSSFVFDYAARQKVGGANLGFFILKQLPVLPPDRYRAPLAGVCGTSIEEWIVARVVECACTSFSVADFAEGCGYSRAPFRWDPERRALARAELDACFFHLYGVDLDDVDWIMESFPIVKRKDVDAHGTYRTKDTILSVYREMAEAARAGTEYKTRLDPPPAHPSLAHAPRSAERPLHVVPQPASAGGVVEALRKKIAAIEGQPKKHRVEVPYFRDLRLAAGRFDGARGVAGATTLAVFASNPIKKKKKGEFHFVGRIDGASMAPTIPDGALCLFRRSAPAVRDGAIVAVQRTDDTVDRGGDFVVKQYQAARAGQPARLLSVNPAFPPLEVTEHDQLFAEFVEVVEAADAADAGQADPGSWALPQMQAEGAALYALASVVRESKRPLLVAMARIGACLAVDGARALPLLSGVDADTWRGALGTDLDKTWNENGLDAAVVAAVEKLRGRALDLRADGTVISLPDQPPDIPPQFAERARFVIEHVLAHLDADALGKLRTLYPRSLQDAPALAARR